MMAEIKIHVFHTGEACVAPDLPFGGEHCSTIKASGAFAKKSERLWLPVSAYLIECSHGKIIFANAPDALIVLQCSPPKGRSGATHASPVWNKSRTN